MIPFWHQEFLGGFRFLGVYTPLHYAKLILTLLFWEEKEDKMSGNHFNWKNCRAIFKVDLLIFQDELCCVFRSIFRSCDICLEFGGHHHTLCFIILQV
jgi:hypothetical protein